MAALAITDTADGRRILALTGRLDATTLPDLWDTGPQSFSGEQTADLVARRSCARPARRETVTMPPSHKARAA